MFTTLTALTVSVRRKRTYANNTRLEHQVPKHRTIPLDAKARVASYRRISKESRTAKKRCGEAMPLKNYLRPEQLFAPSSLVQLVRFLSCPGLSLLGRRGCRTTSQLSRAKKPNLTHVNRSCRDWRALRIAARKCGPASLATQLRVWKLLVQYSLRRFSGSRGHCDMCLPEPGRVSLALADVGIPVSHSQSKLEPHDL